MVVSLKVGAAKVRLVNSEKVLRAVRERTEAIEGSADIAILYEWELDRHMLAVEWKGGEYLDRRHRSHPKTLRPLARAN